MLALSIFVASSLARNLPTRLRASSPRRVNPSRPSPRRRLPSLSPSVRVTTSAITAALTRAIFTSLFPPSSRSWHRSGGGARSLGRRNIVWSRAVLCRQYAPGGGRHWRTGATRIDFSATVVKPRRGRGRTTRTRTWATEERERSWANHHATPDRRRRRRRRGRGRRSRDAHQVVVVRLLKSQEPRPRRRRRRHRRRRVMRTRQQGERNSRA